MKKIFDGIEKHVAQAVSHYWHTRKTQKDKQKRKRVPDAGLRSAVIGGAQMDGFINLFKDLITLIRLSGIKSRMPILRLKMVQSFWGSPTSLTPL